VLITETPTITVVTHNVPPSLPDADAEAAISTCVDREKADVLALQEASHWLNLVAGLNAYDSWYPTRTAPGALPILWRKDTFQVVNEGSDRVYPEDRTVHLEPGAGPDYQRAAWVNWVILQHTETKNRFGFVNAHPLPSIQAGPIRFQLHWQVINRVGTVIGPTLRHLGAPTVIALGDWNATPTSDAMARLRLLPWVCDTLGTPTLGTRSVDDMYRLGKTLQFVAQRRFETASDHWGAAVDYRITA
jgi:hypothetical protein